MCLARAAIINAGASVVRTAVSFRTGSCGRIAVTSA